MRIDVWDIPKAKEKPPVVDCGLPRDLETYFTWEKVIGKGGFGLVRVVREKSTGIEFACKSVSKTLNIPNLAPDKQAQHITNIEREIKILKKLRGTLSVVHFKAAYEDDTDIHMVMEYCRGGELDHQVGRRVYTEEMVASYMRSVLHTIAQCHSHLILHRDIKPGNFMLLNEAEDSPLKAIDFGLAVFYEPDKLPRTDLGLEGTPWFMAPEVLSSTVYPQSDLWAAGVMAYQLLSGYLPFDDARNPENPALSVIWKGILTEQPSFRKTAWKEISDEAKDFVKVLLTKDYTQRPSAKEMLKHPWLQTSFHVSRRRPLSGTVVQRIQRFAQSNLLRRTILDFIAMELIKIMPPELSPGSLHGGSHFFPGTSAMDIGAPEAVGELAGGSPRSPQADASSHSGSEPASDMFPMSPERGIMIPGRGMTSRRSFDGSGHGGSLGLHRRTSLDGSGHGPGSFKRGSLLGRSPSIQSMAALSAAAKRKGATVHGPADYWRIMRAASELAAMESGHGQSNYLHTAARTDAERQEQRKVARLNLDTSVHGGSRFDELVKQLNSESQHERVHKASSSMRAVQSMGALSNLASSAPSKLSTLSSAIQEDAPLNRQRASLEAKLPILPSMVPETNTRAPMEVEERGHGGMAAFAALAQAGAVPSTSTAAIAKEGEPKTVKRVGFQLNESKDMRSPQHATNNQGPFAAASVQQQQQREPTISEKAAQAVAGSVGDNATGAVTTPQDLEVLMRRMHFKQGQTMTKDSLADALHKLGYDLEPSEVSVLFDELDLDNDKAVAPSAFVASQLDWGAFQQNNRELWLECASRAFADLDADKNGRLRVSELINSLRTKLPSIEVDYALEDALIDAGHTDAEELDFEGFLRMVKAGSQDSLEALDQFDPRIRYNTLGLEGDYSMHGTKLQTVPEEIQKQGGANA